MSIAIVAYPGNEALAAALSRQSKAPIVSLEARQFPDGEFYFRVEGDVAHSEVVVACSLDHPNEKTLGLLLLAATFRELGAQRIILVAPYLAYMRQDAAFHTGESVSAKHFAGLLSRSFDALVTVDPHLHRIHALSDLYAIETHVVHAAPSVAEWVRRNVSDPMIVGPDSESEQWVKEIAAVAGCPFLVLQKERHGDRDVRIVAADIDAVRGRTPVLVDDIISTGRTMIAAANQLRLAGSPASVCVGVHAIFAANASAELRSAGVARIVTCNTISHETNEIDLRSLLGQAVAGMTASR